MSQDSDLLFSAAFDDQTQKFFDAFNQNVRQMQTNMQGGMNEIQSGAQQSGFAMAALAGAVGGVTASLVQMAIQAARAIPQLVVEVTKLAAQAEVTETAMITIAEASGISREKILGVRDAMVAMTFSQNSANDSLIRLVGAQVDLTTATELANAALNVSTVIGQSEERTLARMTQAMFTGNQIVLRSLQLQNAATIARRDMTRAAEEQGVAISELNRVQFFANAIIKDAAKFEGAYASASALAGIEAEELGEKVTDLKRAFGQLTQDAYLSWLQFLVERVQAAQRWFRENEDTVEAWAATIGEAVDAALLLVDAFAEIGGTAGKTAIDTLFEMGKALALFVQDAEEVDASAEMFGTTVKRVMVFIIASLQGGIVAFREFFTTIIEGAGLSARYLAELPRALMEGRGFKASDELLQEAEKVAERWAGISDEIYKVTDETIIRLSESWGLIPKAADDAGDSTEKVTDKTEEFNEALKEVAKSVKAINAAFEEEIEAMGIKRMREDIDRAISEARQREDIARNHRENLDRIFKNAEARRQKLIEQGLEDERELLREQADERMELERDHADELVDIEINYQRRLQDIRRDFEYDQAELARRNDAVGLLRLMRQTKKRLEEEKIARDRRVTDAGTEYGKRLSDLQTAQAREREEIRKEQAERMEEYEVWLQAQLSAAEEQRQKNLDNLQRSLDRQREDVERHRRWQDEDLVRRHKKELQTLGQHFASIEGITIEHIERVLRLNGQAIQGLDEMWSAYYKKRVADAVRAVPPPVDYGKNLGWGIPRDVSRGLEGSEWGFQRGGFMVAQRPTQVKVGEGGAEALMALPLSGIVQHRLSGSASIDVNGVSSDMEAQLKPMICGVIKQLVQDSMGAQA